MEMKKYQTPEMEVVKLNATMPLLGGSITEEYPGDGGDGKDVP